MSSTNLCAIFKENWFDKNELKIDCKIWCRQTINEDNKKQVKILSLCDCNQRSAMMVRPTAEKDTPKES